LNDALVDPVALFGESLGYVIAFFIFTILTTPIIKLIIFLWVWAFAH